MNEWALREEINEILIHLITASHLRAHWETMLDCSITKNQYPLNELPVVDARLSRRMRI